MQILHERKKISLWQCRGQVEAGVIDDAFARVTNSSYPYPRNGRAQFRMGTRCSDDYVSAFLEQHANACFLEVGCANGAFLQRLHELHGVATDRLFGISGHDLRGDLDPQISYAVENAETFDGGSAPFHMIVSSHTWGFFADPLGTLSLFFDRLAVGGELLVDSIDLPIMFLERLAGWLNKNEDCKAEVIINSVMFDHKWLVLSKLVEAPLGLPFTYDSNAGIAYKVFPDQYEYFEGCLDVNGRVVC